jgi:hypothetical protein
MILYVFLHVLKSQLVLVEASRISGFDKGLLFDYVTLSWPVAVENLGSKSRYSVKLMEA